MDIRLISANHGVKDGRTWCNVSLKLTRHDGKSVVVSEWLRDDAAAQAIKLSANGNMPLVELQMGYGDNFRVAIKNIIAIDTDNIDF